MFIGDGSSEGCTILIGYAYRSSHGRNRVGSGKATCDQGIVTIINCLDAITAIDQVIKNTGAVAVDQHIIIIVKTKHGIGEVLR